VKDVKLRIAEILFVLSIMALLYIDSL